MTTAKKNAFELDIYILGEMFVVRLKWIFKFDLLLDLKKIWTSQINKYHIVNFYKILWFKSIALHL